MTSRVSVDMPLCSHQTSVEVQDIGNGRLKVCIESTCEEVIRYASMLREVNIEDYSEIRGSGIIEKAADACLTPTCLVPLGVYNACWLETGMISRNLVKKMDTISIRFDV